MEIIQTENLEQEGNDCNIRDEIVLFLVHDKYVVINIRRYVGWCDNGLDFRYRKEFDEEQDAIKYFNRLSKSKCNI
jgi:hypothetical protein